MNATAEPAQHNPPSLATHKEQPAHHGRMPAIQRSRKQVGRVAGVLVIGSVVAWGVHFGVHAYHFEETDDAYVVGHLHTVSAQVDGPVQSVLVNDNQKVRAGEVLLRIDPLQFQIALDKATAALKQSVAQEKQLGDAAAAADAALAEAQAHVKQAEAQRAQTDAQLQLAKLTLARNEQLVAQNGASRADLDQAQSAERAAVASDNAAEANLLAARAAIESATAAQAAAHAQTEAAHAAVAVAAAVQQDAQRQLAYTSVTSPSDGWVGNKHVEAGNRVTAGQALLAVAEPDAWIIANFKETQLAHMRVGQPVELTIDAIPGTIFHGRVDSVSPASGAQFALLPPDNSTGNFNKVVQRVPVKITLDPESRQIMGDRLRLGLSVIVNVRVR